MHGIGLRGHSHPFPSPYYLAATQLATTGGHTCMARSHGPCMPYLPMCTYPSAPSALQVRCLQRADQGYMDRWAGCITAKCELCSTNMRSLPGHEAVVRLGPLQVHAMQSHACACVHTMIFHVISMCRLHAGSTCTPPSTWPPRSPRPVASASERHICVVCGSWIIPRGALSGRWLGERASKPDLACPTMKEGLTAGWCEKGPLRLAQHVAAMWLGVR